MTTLAFPDAEGAVRTWLRSVDDWPDTTEVAFGYPAEPSTDVVIVVSRVGGGSQRGDAPLSDPRLSFSVYASSKKRAASASGWLMSLIEAVKSLRMDGETYCYGATVDTAFWAPEPDSRLVRYVVDATFTVRAA